MKVEENEIIIISDYNPRWAKEFDLLSHALAEYLGDIIITIEHVGSTSVIGMKAKPIIDLDIVIADDQLSLNSVIDKLSKLGYIHRGDLGIPGREAFKRLYSTTPDFGSSQEWLVHHLYVCIEGSTGLANHLNFRDYLRANPQKIIEYSNLKKELAEKFPNEIDRYIDGKTDFIVEVLRNTGMKDVDAELIENQNRIKD